MSNDKVKWKFRSWHGTADVISGCNLVEDFLNECQSEGFEYIDIQSTDQRISVTARKIKSENYSQEKITDASFMRSFFNLGK